MSIKISAVINTFNEEENIERCILSVKWVDEIVVCDMHSSDATVKKAKDLGARVVYFKRSNYVEPARNYATSQAKGDWILLLDADEEIPLSLTEKIKRIIKLSNIDYVQIPRKNIIFKKWIQNANWWPDYHTRLFKKGAVIWNDKIHSKPETTGNSLVLEPKEDLAIIHHHYQSISQFVERMNRYSKIQAQELIKEGYIFNWQDLIKEPLSEFLGRFFANKGYKDGLHGLVLSLLQATSFLLVFLSVWEIQGLKEKQISLDDLKKVQRFSVTELKYWFEHEGKNNLKSFLNKFLRKI